MSEQLAKSPDSKNTPAGSAKKKKSPEQALLYVQDLNKAYTRPGGLFRKAELSHALHNVNFYVRKRETFGLVGESGCGKTTLAMCLLRLIEPTMGRVVFDGKEITADPTTHRLNHTQHGIDGYRRIHGIPPRFQYIQPNLCGKWLTGGNHSVFGDRRRSTLFRLSIRTIIATAWLAR